MVWSGCYCVWVLLMPSAEAWEDAAGLAPRAGVSIRVS